MWFGFSLNLVPTLILKTKKTFDTLADCVSEGICGSFLCLSQNIQEEFFLNIFFTRFPGHESVVRALIQLGAKVNAETISKKSALYSAISAGKALAKLHCNDFCFIGVLLIYFQAMKKWFTLLLNTVLQLTLKT